MHLVGTLAAKVTVAGRSATATPRIHRLCGERGRSLLRNCPIGIVAPDLPKPELPPAQHEAPPELPPMTFEPKPGY